MDDDYFRPHESGKFPQACCDPEEDFELGLSVNELLMIRTPSSIQAFFGLFESSSKPVVLWIRDEDCFVFSSDPRVKKPKEYALEFHWEVTKKDRTKTILYIFSTAIQGILACFDCLFGLSMWPGSMVTLRADMNGVCGPICPLPCEILNKFILQNHHGRCKFKSMVFAPAQCQTLATSGIKTHLIFFNCRFQDGGEAFANAYLSPENQNSGPAKMDFIFSMPFDETRIIACLPKLQELRLSYLFDLSSGLGRALVSSRLDYLHLGSNLRLTDEVQLILNNCIREGHGPKGISVQPGVFSSREKLVQFCEALAYQTGGRTYLKTLELCDLGDFLETEPDPEVERVLLAAWRGNLDLTSFSLTFSIITEEFWNSLVNEMSLHQPSLRRLEFQNIRFQNHITMAHKERTLRLSNLILAHEHVEQMAFCDSLFDEEVWKKRVVPALQHNGHRERFAAVENIRFDPTRKAILAEALKNLNGQPSLLYALLHQNLDVIADAASGPTFGSPGTDRYADASKCCISSCTTCCGRRTATPFVRKRKRSMK